MSKIINPNSLEKFIEIYLSGMKMIDITSTLGMERSTGYTWLKMPNVMTEIEGRQREI